VIKSHNKNVSNTLPNQINNIPFLVIFQKGGILNSKYDRKNQQDGENRDVSFLRNSLPKNKNISLSVWAFRHLNL
jgi:hypothetical protein